MQGSRGRAAAEHVPSIPTSPPSSWRPRAHGDERRVRGAGQPARPPLPGRGPARLDHVAILMENNPRFLEAERRGERTGLYYTLHQLVPVGRRGRLHRQRLRGPGRHHVGGQARVGRRSCPTLSRRRALAHGRHRRARRPFEPYEDAVAAVPARPDRRRAARRGDALLVGHDGAAQGHPAAAARRARRRAAAAHGRSCSALPASARA